LLLGKNKPGSKQQCGHQPAPPYVPGRHLRWDFTPS
jgi:hypothetical protein